MKAYSMDLRERVLADCDAGMKTSAVAAKYTVSSASGAAAGADPARTGRIALEAGGPSRTVPKPSWEAEGYAERLRQAVAARPDATLAELKRKLKLTVTLSTSPSKRSRSSRRCCVARSNALHSRPGEVPRSGPQASSLAVSVATTSETPVTAVHKPQDRS